MEFTGVCLITKNVPVLAEFYKKVLGVEAEGEGELKMEMMKEFIKELVSQRVERIDKIYERMYSLC